MKIYKTIDFNKKIHWFIEEKSRYYSADSEISVMKLLKNELEFSKLHAIAEINCMQYLPPLLSGARVFCVGLNYNDHLTEIKKEKPAYPSIFLRTHESFVGHQTAITCPHKSARFDFEAELAVVIGKPGRYIERDNALQHVAAYTLMAENSVRDYQKQSAQVTAGKNFDASGSLGPCLITADEIPDPNQLEFICRLNQQQQQHGHLAELMFDIPALIEYISTFAELKTGDVIATGTPSGVGNSQVPPLYMKQGDRLEIELLNHCILSNEVVAEY